MKQQEFIEKINDIQTKANVLSDQYWAQFSHMGTWQFWYHVVLLIIPLVLLYRLINRQRLFEILFYGYTSHVIFTYIDSYMVRYGYWDHPFMILPQFPFALSINASLLPVIYMLIYQYCTDRGRNFYLWALVASVVVGFIWVEIHEQHNIFQLHRGITNLHTFISNFFVSVLTYWITRLFLYIKKYTKQKYPIS